MSRGRAGYPGIRPGYHLGSRPAPGQGHVRRHALVNPLQDRPAPGQGRVSGDHEGPVRACPLP